MDEEMVMRSVYLAPSLDSKLRQLAFDLNVTKSDLIRCALSRKVEEWDIGGDALVLADLRGSGQAAGARSVRAAAKADAAVVAAQAGAASPTSRRAPARAPAAPAPAPAPAPAASGAKAKAKPAVAAEAPAERPARARQPALSDA